MAESNKKLPKQTLDPRITDTIEWVSRWSPTWSTIIWAIIWLRQISARSIRSNSLQYIKYFRGLRIGASTMLQITSERPHRLQKLRTPINHYKTKWWPTKLASFLRKIFLPEIVLIICLLLTSKLMSRLQELTNNLLIGTMNLMSNRLLEEALQMILSWSRRFSKAHTRSWINAPITRNVLLPFLLCRKRTENLAWKLDRWHCFQILRA